VGETNTACTPWSAPRSSTSVRRPRSTGASFVTKTITEIGGVLLCSDAARDTSVP
jgi:hypothetical protein